MMVEVACQAAECQFNKGGQCASPSIEVDPNGNCITNTAKKDITQDMMEAPSDDPMATPQAPDMDMDAIIKSMGLG
jgi:hypothetical protein